MGKSNAYLNFMKAIKPDLVRQGYAFSNGFADVAKIAAPMWEKMTTVEKDSYISGNKSFVDVSKKLDTVGNNIQERDNEEKLQAEKIKMEDDSIFNSLPKNREILYQTSPFLIESLLNHHFYIIDFVYRVEYKIEHYQPLEISILKFSLKRGVIDVYHEFIDPGTSEHGLRGPARTHSEETHKIPYDFDFGNSDYQSIWVKVAKFLGLTQSKAVCPFIYVIDKRRPMAYYSLCWLFNTLGLNRPSPITSLYPLENLFVILKYIDHPDICKYSFMVHKLTVARSSMITNEFEYVSNMLCEWHDKREVNHCALGKIRTFAYVILFELQKKYGFESTVNHCPIVDDRTSCVIVDDINMSCDRDIAPLHDKNHKQAMQYSNNINNSDWHNDYSDIRYSKSTTSEIPTGFVKKNTESDNKGWPNDKVNNNGSNQVNKNASNHKFKSPWASVKSQDVPSESSNKDFPVSTTTSNQVPSTSLSSSNIDHYPALKQGSSNQTKVSSQRLPPGLFPASGVPSTSSASSSSCSLPQSNPHIDPYITGGNDMDSLCTSMDKHSISPVTDVPRTGWTGRRRV